MNRYISFINQNIHYIIFSIFFLLIIIIYDDYGFPNDEEISRNNGLIAYNYILEIFNISFVEKYPNLVEFKNYYDKDYGVVFELFLVIIEKILSLEDTKSIYQTRHLFVSIFFFLACIYFYLTLRLFFSKKISLIGILIFILHPRIFSQSFYNSKDIIFLVFFCISSFYLIFFFHKKNFKNILLLSIFVSLTIATRPMGLIIPILFIFFFIMENININKLENSFLLISFCLSSLLLTYIFWPYLWEDPLNILNSLKTMSKFRWIGEVFFNGEYYIAKYMPWYYIPVTVLITTPLIIVFTFSIGLYLSIKKFFFNLINLNNGNENIWKNNLELYLLYSLIVIFLTIFFIIELRATVYTGWRQVYFIYPSIVFISMYCIDLIYKKIKLKGLIDTLLYVSIILNILWIFNNHPYQYNFYNSIISKNNIKNFELDYYGISNLKILNKIIDLSKKEIIKIYVFSVNPYYLSKNMMNESDKKRIQFTENIDEADFIVSNHYYQKYYYKNKKYFENVHPLEVEKYLVENFKLIYEIRSNKVNVNSIYKNK